jgi:Rrf2 family protein
MNKDTRLSGVLHVLVHLSQVEGPLTSETLAKTMGTNPAVFRRTMAGLRNAGYVRTEKGNGGGWALAKALHEISLLDVYSALGRPGLFAIASRSSEPDCKIERAVNAALNDTMSRAEALFVERFSEIKLDQLLPASTSSISVHLNSVMTP